MDDIFISKLNMVIVWKLPLLIPRLLQVHWIGRTACRILSSRNNN
jgi:hypothetical protein